jgi:RNA polymerase sigma factor (sigma-70 family)
MPSGRLEPVVEYLRRAAAAGDGAGVADAELLGRYASARDEAAFELLVWRHARMVHGVCLRVLRHEQDAQDAFQATFLALTRQARRIGRRESVGGWLYKVAYRAALRARARGRVAREQPLGELLDGGAADPGAEAAWRELRAVLDEQVNRLPEAYRAVFVLRCLAGKSRVEVARELGCPVGTVESRLARARERLRAALIRRGVAVPTGLLTAGLCGETIDAAILIAPTVRAAALFAAGKAAAGAVSAEAVVLAKGVLRTMFLTKVKSVATALLAIGVLALAGYGVACRTQAAEAPQDQPPAVQQDDQPEGGDAVGSEVGVVGKVAAGLVRLDLRRDAVVRPGDRLEVYRLQPRPEYLGRVEIVEVMAPRAVAKVVGRAGVIRPGDLLARRLLPDAKQPERPPEDKGAAGKADTKPEVVIGAFAWGEPHNGLRVGLAQEEKAGAAGGARLAVALENVGAGDLVVNLGAMLANGRKQYPSALRVTLTGAKVVRHLRRTFTFVAGRVDPFVVPLPAGSRYTLRYDLAEFMDEDGA